MASEVIRAKVKQGDQWADSFLFEALDENETQTLFTAPAKAYLYLHDADGTLAAKLSSESEDDDDGSIAISQSSNLFQLTMDLPGTVTDDLEVATYYGDLKLEWSSGYSSPWSPDFELIVTRARRTLS